MVACTLVAPRSSLHFDRISLEKGRKRLPMSLQEALAGLEPGLVRSCLPQALWSPVLPQEGAAAAAQARVLAALAEASAEVAALLRGSPPEEAGQQRNAFGDAQLTLDLAADKAVFRHLKACRAVATASSEETSASVDLGGEGYSVAFDPLDGSSVVAANFAVGAIYGVWPGEGLVGRTGREQAAAAYAVYGPRTVLVLARPQQAGAAGRAPHVVQEFLLTGQGGAAADWRLVRDSLRIEHAKVFAPANLRAAADNAAYGALVQRWQAARYTLRYTGGMVPDVHHILTKYDPVEMGTQGGGIFCSPVSAGAPAKLRLLYEVAPLAFVVEAAGGGSEAGGGSALDRRVSGTEARLGVALGSPQEVAACRAALQAGC